MWIRLFNVLYRKHKSWMRQQGTPPTWDRDKASNPSTVSSVYIVVPRRTPRMFSVLNFLHTSRSGQKCMHSRQHVLFPVLQERCVPVGVSVSAGKNATCHKRYQLKLATRETAAKMRMSLTPGQGSTAV